MKLILPFIISALFLTACDEQTKRPAPPTSNISGYKYDDVYWYILNTTYNDHNTTYYYSSSTPVVDFRGVSFTRGNVPEQAKEAIEKGEQLPKEEINENELPTEIEKDLAEQEAAFQEYAETQNQIDHETNASENPAPSNDSSSTDSSSTTDSGTGGDGGSSSD